MKHSSTLQKIESHNIMLHGFLRVYASTTQRLSLETHSQCLITRHILECDGQARSNVPQQLTRLQLCPSPAQMSLRPQPLILRPFVSPLCVVMCFEWFQLRDRVELASCCQYLYVSVIRVTRPRPVDVVSAHHVFNLYSLSTSGSQSEDIELPEGLRYASTLPYDSSATHEA